MREVITLLIDDIDGTKAAETVRFSLDRNDYEIDLSESNAAGLRKSLAEFTAHARRVTGAKAVRIRNRGTTDEIRTWAASRGLTVAPRGRIPATIAEAYRAAQQAPARPRPEPAPDGPQEPAEPPAEPSTDDAAGEPQSTAQSPEPGPGSNEAIRLWAASAGREVKPRGRIPADVRAGYWEAMREER